MLEERRGGKREGVVEEAVLGWRDREKVVVLEGRRERKKRSLGAGGNGEGREG